MQYSQEHLKTIVHAKFGGGANKVNYGGLENREFGQMFLFPVFYLSLFPKRSFRGVGKGP